MGFNVHFARFFLFYGDAALLHSMIFYVHRFIDVFFQYLLVNRSIDLLSYCDPEKRCVSPTANADKICEVVKSMYMFIFIYIYILVICIVQVFFAYI